MKWSLLAVAALVPLLAAAAFREAGWLAPRPAPPAASPAVGRSAIPREVRMNQVRHWRALVLQATR